MAIRAVPVQLGGKERELKLELEAWAALQDRDYDLEAMIDQLREGKLKLRGVLMLIWAALQHYDDPPTPKDVGRWVNGENFTDVLEKLGEALRLSFPKKATESPPQEAAGIGTKPSGSPTVLSV